MIIDELDIRTTLGEIDLSYDSGNFDFSEEELKLFIFNLEEQKNQGDVFFYDIYKTLLNMIGIHEYSQYREEELEEFLIGETEFGKEIGIENKNIQKALLNSGFRLSKDNQLVHINSLKSAMSSQAYLNAVTNNPMPMR